MEPLRPGFASGFLGQEPVGLFAEAYIEVAHDAGSGKGLAHVGFADDEDEAFGAEDLDDSVVFTGGT